MRNAEIISVGSELLLGQIANTDAQYVSQFLRRFGINVFYHTAVGDNPDRVAEVFQIALKRSDMIVFTGGLGPTKDDLTKEAVAAALGKSLVQDPVHAAWIKDHFTEDLWENNLRQALIPEGSETIVNNHGTAPGIWYEGDGKLVMMLPGPPKELVPMLEEGVAPRLQHVKDGVIVSKVLAFAGIGESALELKIKDILAAQTNPTVAPLAKDGVCTLRVTARAQDEETAKALIEPKCQELLGILGEWLVFDTYHDDDLETFVAKELIASGKTLALAESITGGSIAASLVKTPGMSNALLEGCVVYTNAAKQRLGVSEKLLQDYTAVSAEVAKALAGCVRLKAGSDIGLAVTGYAGPNDGDKTGLVYIAVSTAKSLSVREYHLSGQRDRIISRAVFHALRLLLETL